MKNIIIISILLQMNVSKKVKAPSRNEFHKGLWFGDDAMLLPAHRLGTPRFAHDVVDCRRDGEHRDEDGDGIELEVHRGADPQQHPDKGAHLGNPTDSLFACHTILLFNGFKFGLVASYTPIRDQCVRRYSELISENRLITKGYIIHLDYF